MSERTPSQHEALDLYKQAREYLSAQEQDYAQTQFILGYQAKLIEAKLDMAISQDVTYRNDTARKAASVLLRDEDDRLLEIRNQLHVREQRVMEAKARYDAAHMTMRVVLAQTVREER